ncbi:NAD(P)(+) transhydrogenase (Re/Si-specific) subunit beta [Sphingomonas koreensis]|jgi:NAD(P) transhydrogenase subunit beta|uniref:NAD(P) transhydrogenase subunit beta n=1 Tax=Sphingomonas koreensis TaxID=93064 RepID=A0A1L6J6H1_9SPHN|nr:NAD(P)(+) transhydrogenase (Re/Si-specific) subunit beta [Sphingomonas koreensis]APR51474.1 NAD synthetase [Sphingomonas koreensis]MDC7811055.1 NAD(P)(+) transhydrogenase (Re/Si-specific) subunit beta [Sphingomonas koreensis]RSU22638.1 NAD(P)(+) transhydrogenase (Re/Si-specific) subunit beta [Sphingomonas koreensis]RSU27667.1 NAD(P)(+) transhydrogenase (Re/Si-specific) subunit beta [Sphingomonas koreensis]RSU29177.1 NAD(P)(+) transhydrogenase (Re/Si-specific) subunit beta [Sphingomonas kore
MHEAVPLNPWVALAYLIAGVCFIVALRGLSSPATSRRGNRFGMAGMLIAVVTTLVTHEIASLPEILGAIAIGGGFGWIVARKIKMTDMPQLVAGFHSLVGLAAVLVGVAAYLNPEAFGIVFPAGSPDAGLILPVSRIELGLGVAIGAITFSGSVIAFLKLNGNMGGAPIMLPGRHVINLGTLAAILGLIAFLTVELRAPDWVFWTVLVLSFVIGFLLIIPIGGADMPVVVSMLNSYSGWAAAAMGFTLGNTAMIITGALVGSSGAILSYIMCRAMNRSFISVIAGGFGGDSGGGAAAAATDRPWKRGSAEDAAFLMSQAEQVIIVPGYGMAVAQAQHVLREMADKLKEHGVRVKYAIHPVAGRMPGHMNVLLAEANVPYDEVFELEDINSEFSQTDVAFIIGANDVVNPAAKTDKSSPIYGMPVFDVNKAKTVLFIKRSMGGVGYAGVDNDVFYQDNTMMLLADAKKMVEEIVKSLD